MKNQKLPIDVLISLVMEQLSKQHYMESTLAVYRRTYARVERFTQEQSDGIYTPEIGAEFLKNQKVKPSTFSAYKCAVRRLDDCLDGKEYLCHYRSDQKTVCVEYIPLLEEFICYCRELNNKESTIHRSRNAAVTFLDFLSLNDCHEIQQLEPAVIAKGLLLFENRDLYVDIRKFLRFLYQKKYIERDFSSLVPHNRRRKPVPSVYTVGEIKRIEETIDISTDTGIRNICLIRLATRMGLRAGDIAKLSINEIDLDTGRLRFNQEKTGTAVELEMPQEVLEPIKLYLENQTDEQLSDGFVFHSLTAPYNHVTSSIIRHVVNECIQKSGIDTSGRKHGPHAFRSSLASSMVNDDIPYETVRRILGHTDPNVIMHYAKTDIERLRLCAIDPPSPTGKFEAFLLGRQVISYV